MKKAIKSFCAFTPLGYKVMMFFVLPVLVIFFNAFSLYVENELLIFISFMGAFLVLLFVDVLSDKWVLNGFYMKSNHALEFLQTSNEFENFVRRIVIVDMVRRILMYVIVFVVMLVLGMLTFGENVLFYDYLKYAYFPLLMYVIGQSMLWIGRHFNSLQSIWLVSCAANTVASFCMTVFSLFGARVNFGPLYWGGVYGSLSILAIAISVITVWYSLKKVRDSYYDK